MLKSKGRGLRDALNRALAHVNQAKESRAHAQRKLEFSLDGGARVGLAGGLVLSVDLSKAFDTINRTAFLEALSLLGVPRTCLSKSGSFMCQLSTACNSDRSISQ